jgi:hypothetical protein
MRTVVAAVFLVVTALAAPAAADCDPVDAERLLADAQAAFVGVLLSQTDGSASFVVREVVTGPLEEGPLEVVVVGDPFPESDESMGYLLGRAGGEWTGDGCHVVSADELRALAPSGATGVEGGSHADEPPYSLFLLPLGVIVIGVVISRVRSREA